MSTQAEDGFVVWQRQIDTEKAQQRWTTFAKFYGVPLVIALVVALVAGGPGAMLGVLILLGSLGALGALGIALYNKNLASNPQIHLVDLRLVFGRHTVSIPAIEAWTTHKHQNVDSAGAVVAASARFRIPVMRDGSRGLRPDGGPAFEIIAFEWPEMTTDELQGVRAALEPHIDCPWQPLDRLHD